MSLALNIPINSSTLSVRFDTRLGKDDAVQKVFDFNFLANRMENIEKKKLS